MVYNNGNRIFCFGNQKWMLVCQGATTLLKLVLNADIF